MGQSGVFTAQRLGRTGGSSDRQQISFGVPHFTLIMSLLLALVGFGFTFCGFRALGIINLSLYSVFSMLGGMVLPFLQGILFYGEPMTWAKVICLIFITLALLLTVERGGSGKGWLYYVGIFVLNGMSGVICKIFSSSPFEKTCEAGFTILSSICTIVLALVFMVVFYGKKTEQKITPASLAVGFLSGGSNKVANYRLLLALFLIPG